jgi:hypothetical protein
MLGRVFIYSMFPNFMVAGSVRKTSSAPHVLASHWLDGSQIVGQL